MYELPKFNLPKLTLSKKEEDSKSSNNKIVWGIILILISAIFGFLAGILSVNYYFSKLNIEIPSIEKIIERETITEYVPQTSEEEKIIKMVEEISSSVVSIIVTKDIPVVEVYYDEFGFPNYRQIGVEKQEVGGGSGFIVSGDGLILTNKHVVLDAEADFTVLTNDNQKFSAEVLARDPLQDLAILKIEPENPLSVVKLGDSENLKIGQTVVAIGNSLGEFRNTVSVGVVSGLGRDITAAGGGLVETIENVIQTDAAINKGNSGGPLLNLKGEVVGINTATVLEAQNISFAIPVNDAKRDIEQVKTLGKIVVPFLGIRYALLTEALQSLNDLPVDYGAYVLEGPEGEPAVVPGSAAEKAGIEPGDIILEFNNEKITTENSLTEIIMKYKPGDKVVLRILRGGKDKIIQVTLGERSG